MIQTVLTVLCSLSRYSTVLYCAVLYILLDVVPTSVQIFALLEMLYAMGR